ncbi:50S ribosomal protein L21 [Acidobacteriota bacterium]
MFAVIKTGGKQYKVQQGDILQVEKLGLDKEKTIIFKEVLLVEDGKKTLIGTPFVDKAKVHAVIIENIKDDKVIVFKKKRRKQYKKIQGHRQELSRIRIEDITVDGAAPKKTQPAVAVKKEEPVKTKPAAKKAVAVPKVSPAKKTEAKKPVKKAAAPKVAKSKPAPKDAASKPKSAPKKTMTTKSAAPTKPVKKTKEK